MRSLLFVPADSPKKFAKGMTSGADALIIDLEDLVAPANKAQARQTALGFLKEAATAPSRPYLVVRVNGLDHRLDRRRSRCDRGRAAGRHYAAILRIVLAGRSL